MCVCVCMYIYIYTSIYRWYSLPSGWSAARTLMLCVPGNCLSTVEFV